MIAALLSLGPLCLFYQYYDSQYVPTVNPSDRETFQGYGITIQYPVGAVKQTIGFLNKPANSSFGSITWRWNGYRTTLQIQWFNTSSNTIDLQPFMSGPNATLIESGNTTIIGENWNYITFHLVNDGILEYETVAQKFYQSENRLYTLSFRDYSNDTLAQLGDWGATFIS